jgi:hypothetical protein
MLVLASTVILGSESRETHAHILFSHKSGGHTTHSWVCNRLVVRSVKLLLGFASSLLKIHDLDLYSLLDMYLSRNGDSSSTTEVSVILCRGYVCCTVDRLLSFRYILTIWYDTDRVENCVQRFFYFCMYILCRGDVFTDPLLFNGRFFWLHYFGFQALGRGHTDSNVISKASFYLFKIRKIG